MSGLVPVLKKLYRRPAIWVMRLMELCVGLPFVSPAVQKLWAGWLEKQGPASTNAKAAMVAHVYYADMMPEIIACWTALPKGSPLFITTPPAKEAEVRAVAPASGLVSIHVLENRGRDIAPFMSLLQDGVLDGFDAVLKLHTKKSPHLRFGELRRQVLYKALSGNPANVRRILSHFLARNAGVVGLKASFRKRPSFWFANRATIERLCPLMVPPAEPVLGFFEGSMFWVRPCALSSLRSLQLTRDDYDAEAGQLDGTLHHAIERMFTLSALACGYNVASISGHVLMQPRNAKRA